jgi:hypothetical protein
VVVEKMQVIVQQSQQLVERILLMQMLLQAADTLEFILSLEDLGVTATSDNQT